MSYSEFEIIRRYFAESGLDFTRDGVALSIGDDAALLSVPADKLLAMSMDVLVDGVHFPADADPELLGCRALAVNLSDLAAMAAEPFCFTLGLCLPAVDADWLTGFSKGLLNFAKRYNCPLVGGDISRGPLSIAIQVQGLVQAGKELRRRGAAIGDQIYVSGSLGDGAIALPSMGIQSQLGTGLQFKTGQPGAACQDYFRAAFYKPEPRIELAQCCATLFSSGLDISDGLAGDLGHLLRASEVGASINLADLPYSDAAMCCMDEPARQLAALFGGDDYELCVTVAPQHCAAAEAAANEISTRFTRIGEIVAGSGITTIDAAGVAGQIDAAAFQHFREQD